MNREQATTKKGPYTPTALFFALSLFIYSLAHYSVSFTYCNWFAILIVREIPQFLFSNNFQMHKTRDHRS